MISSLDKLIAKKKDIKQGAMQQLLMGKIRLKGFAEPWVEKKLGDEATLQRGFDLPNSQLRNGKIPVVYSNGICNYHNVALCKAPGLVTGRSGTIGHFTFIEKGYYWPHNTTLWVTSFKDNYPKYIYYLFLSLHFEDFSGGSGVPTLNRNNLYDKMILLPSSLAEQRAIATILTDMDNELSALEAKRSKYAMIKDGMMQQLLTGKIRLTD